MRQIKLSNLYSDGIKPLGNHSQRDVSLSENLSETLLIVFPERKSYWEKNNWKVLNISFSSVIPFGPDPELLSSYLFNNLEEDIQYMISRFQLKEVIISGLPSFPERSTENRKQLHLTAHEFKQLVDAGRTKRTFENQILSVFIDKGKIYSYSVSSSMDFKTLFSSAPELKDMNPDDYMDTINGVPLKGENVIGSTQIRHISPLNWRFESNSNILFNYPEFNRTIKMTESAIIEEPCINCLACAAVCPAGLYPATIYHHLKEENLAEAIAMGLNYCLFCRRCSVVCPSAIPLSSEIVEAVKSNMGENE